MVEFASTMTAACFAPMRSRSRACSRLAPPQAVSRAGRTSLYIGGLARCAVNGLRAAEFLAQSLARRLPNDAT